MYISSPPIAIETRAIGKPPLHIAGAVDLDVIDLGRDIASSVGRTRRLRSALAPIDVVHAGQTPQQLEAEFLELSRGEIAEVQGVHRRPSLRPPRGIRSGSKLIENLDMTQAGHGLQSLVCVAGRGEDSCLPGRGDGPRACPASW